MGCSVSDEQCIEGRLRRGMCERHYRRWLHRGDTSNPRTPSTVAYRAAIQNLAHYEVDAAGCWLRAELRQP